MPGRTAASVLHFRVKRVAAASVQEVDAATRAIEECRIIVAQCQKSGDDPDAALFAFELTLHRRGDALVAQVDETRGRFRERLRGLLRKVDSALASIPESEATDG